MPDRVRRPLVAANWKMHKNRAETEAFLDRVLDTAGELSGAVDLVICPPYTSLAAGVERARGTEIRIAAQSMHFEAHGAFTGEVSPGMLVDVGAQAVLLGHSERRQLFGETDVALARKVPAALDAGLLPILCVGETEAQRDAEETKDVLRAQVEADLAAVEEEGRLREVVIAYEPIWAIGTGRTASADQAQDAIAFIRSLLAGRDSGAGDAIRILYGGSVKPENAEELMAQEDVDGALVGGASLEPDDFLAIAAAAA
jgi:triosephosphate isomerase